jgi:hypothetical protein
MQFETSQKLTSHAPISAIADVLEEQFRKVAGTVERVGDELVVKDIQATFGSVNRSDTTHCTIRTTNGRYLLVAATTYSPTLWFWIFFVCGVLFSFIGTIIPLGFYFWNKKIVQDAITDVLRRVENELDSGGRPATAALSSPAPVVGGDDAASQIARFGQMLREGLITKEEFDQTKRRLLQLDSPPEEPPAYEAVAVSLPDDQRVFVRRNERVSGPFTVAQVRKAVESGKLSAADEIGTSRTGPWSSTSVVQG